MTFDNPDTITSATPSAPAAGHGRTLILIGAVSVALVSTAAAYVAMVGFGRDVLAMSAGNAYAFAGVFELSLVTVALMAREAAQQNRPAQTLLTLTWLLSMASGIFAGWHEVYMGHSVSAVGFRFLVPLLAALMWHLALVGDRHLAMERSWSDLRAGARIHAMLDAGAARSRAVAADDGSRRARRRLARATARRDRTESVALRTSDPSKMRELTAQWGDAFDAVRESRAVTARFATDPLTDLSAGPLTATVVDVTGERLSAQALNGVSAQTLTDERSSARALTSDARPDERSNAHDDGEPALTDTTAHTAPSSENTTAQHLDEALADERSTAQRSSDDQDDASALSAQDATEMSAQEDEDAHTTSAHDERSPLTVSAHERSSEAGLVSLPLRAVPEPTAMSAGPERDAIVDEMLANDDTVTGVQVADRLGLAAQSGRRELNAARKRAAARATAVNQ